MGWKLPWYLSFGSDFNYDFHVTLDESVAPVEYDRPVAKAEMLIRRPVADVFEAFVSPAITSKFWFSQGSGRLEVGREVIWEMYDFSVQVNVKAVDHNARIVLEWSAYGAPTPIEWIFTAQPG